MGRISSLISIYALFPMLLLETMLYVPMNIYLLWMWYRTGQWDTLVNKLICIQRICGILYSVGCLVDFFFRLDGMTFSFFSPANSCSCWMIYYKFLIFIYQTSQLAMAILRFICVKYPIDYHIRYCPCFGLATDLRIIRFPSEESKKFLLNRVLLSIVTISSLLTALDKASIYCI